MDSCMSTWLGLTALTALFVLGASPCGADMPELDWRDAVELGVEGQGWKDTKTPYDRMPARAEGVIRGPVWGLSLDSAGLNIRFVTNAETIGAKWTLRDKGLDMPHMPATGVSGLDLYVNDHGTWKWIGNGRPGSQTNEKVMASGIPEGEYEYMLYLPLYNGISKLEIGVTPGAKLEKGPDFTTERAKPIMFYGTSILQGGCASRPGMVYTSIIGRMLHRPVINLGFSGNGTMDPEFFDFMAEVDVAAYVIDCCPNMQPDQIAERTEPGVEKLRAAHPDTPIVLVENIEYQEGTFLPRFVESYTRKNAALHAAFERLVAKGVKNLHYIPCDALLGTDGEGTVDGTHATDLGFLRMADAIGPVLAEILDGKAAGSSGDDTK